MRGNHTPGPWTLVSPVNHETHPRMADWRQDVIGPADSTRANSHLVVATIINQDSPEGPANACLIAAAPDLFNALVVAQATIERLQRHAPGSALGTLDVIRAALTKATPARL